MKQSTDIEKRSAFLLSLKRETKAKQEVSVNTYVPQQMGEINIYGLVFIKSNQHTKIWLSKEGSVIVREPKLFTDGFVFTIGEYYELLNKCSLDTAIMVKTVFVSGSEVHFSVIARKRWDGVYLGAYN
jgi:hypothetical protein